MGLSFMYLKESTVKKLKKLDVKKLRSNFPKIYALLVEAKWAVFCRVSCMMIYFKNDLMLWVFGSRNLQC